MSLRVCPECDYDLAGLPEAHRCPECGTPYDELTRVWKPRRPWALIVASVGGCLMIGIQIVIATASLVTATTAVIALLLLVVALGLLVVNVALHVIRITRSKGKPLCLATTPAGIVVRLVSLNVVIPWSEVARVRRGELYSGRTLRFAVHIDRVRGPTISVMRVLRSDEEVVEVIALCEEARRRALTGGTTSTGAYETFASLATEPPR